jgi:hypothetical protein
MLFLISAPSWLSRSPVGVLFGSSSIESDKTSLCAVSNLAAVQTSSDCAPPRWAEGSTYRPATVQRFDTTERMPTSPSPH